MLHRNIIWIIKLAILLITVRFSINQKYGYYLTTTYNITSTQAVLSSSELLYNISQISRNFDIEIRGTILNLRNNNKTGDIFSIIYSKETSLNKLNIVLTNLSNKLKDLTFYNTNVYLLYFVEFDVELSNVFYNEKYLNNSSTEYMNVLNQIKSSPEINSLGIQLFDPPIPTFNKIFVSFRNKPGNLRGTIFATVYSVIDYQSSMQLTMSFPYYLTNFNATIHQGCWDKISMYSTSGNSIYEFYFTASFKLIQSTTSFYLQADIIDFISKISGNISNALLTYGVGINGELLSINNTIFTIDYHGSLFRENENLKEMNDIVSMALSTVSSVTFTNFKIYNVYTASIYAYLDNNIYNLNNYLNNSIKLQDNLIKKISNGLIQENMFVINENYFDFIFQWQAFENRIRAFVYLLIYTEKTSLFDVENGILKIIVSLPSVVDPFNSHVARAEKFTTGIYPNYSIPNVIFNISTDGRLTTIYSSTMQTTTKKESIISTSTLQGITSKESTVSTSTIPTTTQIPTTSTISTTTQIPTTSTIPTTSQIPTTSTITTTTQIPTTSTITTTTQIPTTSTITTTTQIPTTSMSTIKTTTTKKPAEAGETEATVDLTCKFKEDFKETYNDKESYDYKSFTSKMTNDIDNSFKKKEGLRLIQVIYTSIRKGSVIVDFTLYTVSTSEIKASQLTTNIIDITNNALGPNVTIENINVTSIIKVSSVQPVSTDSPTIKPDAWKIAVGVLFGMIGFIGIILIVLYFLGYLTNGGKINKYGGI